MLFRGRNTWTEILMDIRNRIRYPPRKEGPAKPRRAQAQQRKNYAQAKRCLLRFTPLRCLPLCSFTFFPCSFFLAIFWSHRFCRATTEPKRAAFRNHCRPEGRMTGTAEKQSSLICDQGGFRAQLKSGGWDRGGPKSDATLCDG